MQRWKNSERPKIPGILRSKEKWQNAVEEGPGCRVQPSMGPCFQVTGGKELDPKGSRMSLTGSSWRSNEGGSQVTAGVPVRVMTVARER